MSEHDFDLGERVRFTSEALGTVTEDSPYNFTEHVVGIGDEGVTIIAPPGMPEGWLAVRPDAYPDEYVPVHPGMLERI